MNLTSQVKSILPLCFEFLLFFVDIYYFYTQKHSNVFRDLLWRILVIKIMLVGHFSNFIQIGNNHLEFAIVIVLQIFCDIDQLSLFTYGIFFIEY